MRTRLLDLAVATVCVACMCAPLLPTVVAATSPDPAVVESGGTVDQRVLQSGIISNPLNASFPAGTSGTVDGSVSWDLYSSSPRGLKLVVSSDRSPAMRDAANGVDVADYGSSPTAWSVAGTDRRFGFTVAGPIALSRFANASKWRGFEGGRSVEAARRGAALPKTRTTVRLRAQFGSPLASNARPAANVNATAVVNL